MPLWPIPTIADEAPGSRSIVTSQYHLPVIQPRVALALLHGPVVLPVPVRSPLDRVIEASVLFGSNVITGLRVIVVVVVLLNVDAVLAVLEEDVVLDVVEVVVEVVDVVLMVVVLDASASKNSILVIKEKP